MAQESPKNFFLSYAHTDLAWAEWIAWELEQEGYTVFMPAWDVQPGNNVVRRKHQEIGVAQHTLVVLSPGYLEDESLQADWSVAFHGDSDPQQRKVLPVKVQDCVPTGYLSTLKAIDLAISIIRKPRKMPCSPAFWVRVHIRRMPPAFLACLR